MVKGPVYRCGQPGCLHAHYASARRGSDVPEPTVYPTRYTVSCLPKSFRDRHYWDLHVEEQHDGKWLITDGAYWWDRSGERHQAYSGSYAACVFADETEAREVAVRLAPLVTVNDCTPAEALARHQRLEQHDA